MARHLAKRIGEEEEEELCFAGPNSMRPMAEKLDAQSRAVMPKGLDRFQQNCVIVPLHINKCPIVS